MTAPFDVTYHDVPDERLGALLSETAKVGLPTPVITPAGGQVDPSGRDPQPVELVEPVADDPEPSSELPSEWRLVRRREGESYRWPENREAYPRYSVYAGQTTREGIVHIALGEAERAKAWGRDRPYIIAFLTSGAPQTPLVEFLATDDYEESGEYLAIVRGRDGGRRLYGPGDTLPDVYEQHFHTQMYGDRVDYPGVWNKVVVIAHEDDHATMLNHALVQARRRGDL